MEKETYWFNQSLLYYRNDEHVETYLDIFISTSTVDFLNINSPLLRICVGLNLHKKYYNFSLENCNDFLNTIKKVSEEKPFENNINIVKRYNKNKNLKVEFKLNNRNEKIIVISIIENNMDESIAVLSKDIFVILCSLFKNYSENYFNVCMETSKIANRFLLNEILTNIKTNNRLLETLPSSLLEIKYNKYVSDDYNKVENINEETIANAHENLDANNILNDLDNFIGGSEMDRIKIKEIDKIYTEEDQEKSKVIITSQLINNVLNNDISNFENMMTSVLIDNNPLSKIIDKFKISMNLKDRFYFLPEIKEEEMKSACYISNLFFKSELNRYINNDIAFTRSIPILKYQPKFITNDNIDLSLDLLLIIIYLKILFEKVETVEKDSQKNKLMLYVSSRWYLDLLIFSFLKYEDVDTIKSCINNRFESYSKNNFFKYYEDLLSFYNLSNITSSEVSSVVNKIVELLKSKETVNELHNKYFENNIVKISSKNDLSLEQITNEIIKLEVLVRNEDEKDIDKIIENHRLEISEISKNIFKNSKIPRKSKDYGTNLLRYAKFNNSEIPNELRDDIIKYIEELSDNDFDYKKYSLEQFGDNIIKGIYIWNESENKHKPYSDFVVECENTLERDLIISKIKMLDNSNNLDEEIPWFS